MHFKRLPAWAQIICLLAVAFVVAWGFWMALRDTLCTIEAKDLILKRPIRGSCFEFWLNRYQSALGTLATLVVAWFAWRGVQRQIREQSKSNRIAEIGQWQARAAKASAQIDQLKIAMQLINDVIVVEYDARLTGSTDTFMHRAFAERLLRGGLLPLQTIEPEGIELISFEFNRLTAALDRTARHQTNSNLLTEELRDTYFAMVRIQTDILSVTSVKDRELALAESMLVSLERGVER